MSASYEHSHDTRDCPRCDDRDPPTRTAETGESETKMFIVQDDPSSGAEATDISASKPGAKVTQRMLLLREMIADGSYPDKDELAERILDKL